MVPKHPEIASIFEGFRPRHLARHCSLTLPLPNDRHRPQKTAPEGAVLHVGYEWSAMREMRLAVVPSIPAVVIFPPVMAIPIMVGTMMLDNHRAMMVPAMIILSFSISCGQSDNAQRDERRCQNFHF